MVDRITDARRAVATASDVVEDETIRTQLHSIDRGLAAVGEEPDDPEKGDRLEEVESKLVALGDRTDDGAVLDRIEEARDLVDAYRRDRARDWET